MEKIKENKKTRQINWLWSLCGNVGKSIFTDMLKENSRDNCLVLIIDSY